MPRRRFRPPSSPSSRPSADPPLIVDVVGRGPTQVPRKVAARLRARYPDAETLGHAFATGAIYFCRCCDRFRCTDIPELRE